MQSCAWFSAVDIDHVLRKEVNMDCVTPSQPIPIPHGLSQDISDTLAQTHQGSLFKDGRDMSEEQHLPRVDVPSGGTIWTPSGTQYRSKDLSFLLAQNASSERALKEIEKEVLSGQRWDWGMASAPPSSTPSTSRNATRGPRVIPPRRVASPRTARPDTGPMTSIPRRRAPEMSSSREGI
jgi:DNA polymerase gamma 1